MAERTQQLAVDDAAESCVEERGGLLRTAVTVSEVVGSLLVVQRKNPLNPAGPAGVGGDLACGRHHRRCSARYMHDE
jgi:hypothetical protein